MIHKALEPLELKLSLLIFGRIHLHEHIVLTRTNIIINPKPIRPHIPLTIHPLLTHPIPLKVPRLHRILPPHPLLPNIPLDTEFRFDLKHRKRISE